MKLNLSKLCGIAAEHRFLSFLYEVDPDLFLRYRMELINSSGCKKTRLLIDSTINSLNKLGHIEKFEQFISKNYPDCIASSKSNEIFPDYDPKIITIPHRIIMNGNQDGACDNKLICKCLEYKGLTYIEYLKIGEEKYLDKVSWILDNYSGTVVYNQN